MQENNKEISPIKKRILKYLDYKGITQYKCYKETGISKNVLSQKNGLNEENLVRFLKTYKDANPIWVTIGEGSMLLTDLDVVKSNENIEEKEIKPTEIPPDFILKRYEELVIRNNELERLLKDQKNEVQYMSGIEQTLMAAEPQIELNDKEKK